MLLIKSQIFYFFRSLRKGIFIMIYCYLIIIFFLPLIYGTIDFNCDCGYKELRTNSIWNEMWYMDFEEKKNFANQYLYSHKDFFFSNYEIPAKFNDSFARVFRKENVVIKDQSLEIAITIDGIEPIENNENQRIKCGGIGTTRQDFLYGSFRSYMRTTQIDGTVAGMFLYHPEGEIDIELLSSVKPSQAYFAIHPGLTENGKASSLTHGNYILNFDPSQDFHEYRFDWFPNLTIFYIDGIEQYRIITNVLSLPSRVMFNHWTDGNKNFSQGPVKENAYLNIKNMTFFFNSSDTELSTPKCINVNTTCNIKKIVATLKNNNTVFDSYLTIDGEDDSLISNSFTIRAFELYIYLFIFLTVFIFI